MQARSSRLAALTIAIFVAAMAVISTVPSASASTGAGAPAADAQTCQRPPPRNDDTIHFTGCLLDQRSKPAKPVPDVTINVEDESGKVVGTAKSDETGIFDIPLPGKSIDNLGKTFTVKIDTDTLPKGTALRNPKQVSLDRTLNLDSDVFVAFPIGNDSSGLDQQGRAGPAAPGGRAGVLAAAGHGRPRPLDDLRHHGIDELLPRRADHLRRAGRLRSGLAAGDDHDR